VLDQLLGASVEEADMRVGALDDLAVHLQHQPHDAVRRRVLRPEIHREVADFRRTLELAGRAAEGHGAGRVAHAALPGTAGGVSSGALAFSSPGNILSMP